MNLVLLYKHRKPNYIHCDYCGEIMEAGKAYASTPVIRTGQWKMGHKRCLMVMNTIDRGNQDVAVQEERS